MTAAAEPAPAEDDLSDVPLAQRVAQRAKAQALPTSSAGSASSSSCDGASSSDGDAEFDPATDVSDSQTEAASSWSCEAKKKRRASKPGAAAAAAQDGAVFCSSQRVLDLSADDSELFARRRQHQQEQQAEAQSPSCAERALTELLQSYVRGHWALFETQTNLHVQLRNCATQLTSRAAAAQAVALPTALIEQAANQSAELEQLRGQVDEAGGALQEARRKREKALADQVDARSRKVEALAQQLAEEQSGLQQAEREMLALGSMREACESSASAVAGLTADLQAAEQELQDLTASSQQIMERHADVARERHARAVQDAAERSQREAAALHLHLGQAEQAASALGELDSVSAATAQARQSAQEPEEVAVQLLAEAQLRPWSDTAFPVVSKRVDLIRTQAQVCWGITLKDGEGQQPPSTPPKPIDATPVQVKTEGGAVKTEGAAKADGALRPHTMCWHAQEVLPEAERTSVPEEVWGEEYLRITF